MKHFFRCIHILIGLTLTLLLALSFALATVQTRWVKDKLRDKLIEAASKEGIILKIDTIEGRFPLSWTLNHLYIQIGEGDFLFCEKAHVRIGLFSLLQKKIAITYAHLSETKLTYSKETHLPPLSIFSLPFHLSLRSFKADNIDVENYETKQRGVFSLYIKGKLKKRAKAFFGFVKLVSALDGSHVQLLLKGAHSKKQVISALKVRLKSTEALHPFLYPSFTTDCFFAITLDGSWDSWAAFLGEKFSAPPLQGKISGKTRSFKFLNSETQALNRHWNLASSFALFADHSLDISSLSLSSNLLSLKAHAAFDRDFHLKGGDFSLKVPEVAPLYRISLYSFFPLQGAVDLNGKYTGNSALITFTGKELMVGKQPFESVHALLKATQVEPKIWRGEFELNARDTNVPVQAQGHFSLKNETYALEHLSIVAPDTKIGGDLSFSLKEKQLEGALFAQFFNLNHFQTWLPESYLGGKAGVEISFQKETKERESLTEINLITQNLRLYRMHASDLSLTVKLYDPFRSWRGMLSFDAEGVYFPNFSLSSAEFTTSWNDAMGPFQLALKGLWKDPLEIESSGTWTPHSLTIKTLQGNVFKQPLALTRSFHLEKDENHFLLNPCKISFGEGSLSIGFDLSKNWAEGTLIAEHFPLTFLSLYYPHLALDGSVSIDAFLKGNPEDLQGKLSVLLEHIDLLQSESKVPFKAKGTLEAHLDNKILQFQANVQATKEQFIDARGTLPLEYTLHPFLLSVDHTLPLSGELTLEGDVEELFDFIDLGSHRATGQLSCHLILSKNLLSPQLQGFISLNQGTYENYYTGTLLKKIEANLEANQNQLKLVHFEAMDNNEGTVTAEGSLTLDLNKRFPYALHLDLNHLNALHFEAIDAQFTGPLSIEGTLDSATAQGKLSIAKAELSIPDQLPPDLPVLPVVYINKPLYITEYTINPPSLFPLHLDLELTTARPISLRGRGLSSYWEGSIHVNGTNTNAAATGTLTLIKGDFVFSGKVFQLSQGEITLTNKPTQGAYINLRGELSLPEVSVIVLLTGPLQSPILTFQSTPHMPTSSLLSYILFNKDISEISPLQAIQLAQTIVSLSGGAGPDVLEKIRRSLGVDRLSIVSGQGSDEVSVQIGKYLTRGVMVTLSQGVDNSKVIVEVELSHGFLLQAETTVEQEGKFSLKWNKNY